MNNLSDVFREVTSKYRIFEKEQRKLLLFLIGNFSEDSLAVKDNLKEDSPVFLAFKEFKSIID